ncbi:uncharacterized protein ACLA_086880 [Aspergillus clavatus NRRL 1]|uniref:Uncharacterized protein n=1 Tax=Aspergillus clavatus (strain ATCC 1007 / CBS 513.65 / DSM 816 / NCTC 3887 / NRRL 1 / QM 1276 / 107) TaxID=344612 RepID=A1CUJ9_ASPCL|nr:uncharacterized protein ACLA_086880 [Aspergillus clavatus NRRL 1]EAW06986.1 conserved hypothetical protein [Aspergillus clavatus NRRL 1]
MAKRSLTPTYASRLHNLTTLNTPSKQILLRSIADDITAVFIRISKHIEKGTLGAEHTAPINDVIEIITGTEVSQRRRLEQRVRRYAVLARRLKGEREWVRREFGALVERVERVSGVWRERVLALREVNRGMRREMGRMRGEWEMVKLKRERLKLEDAGVAGVGVGVGGESRDEAEERASAGGTDISRA